MRAAGALQGPGRDAVTLAPTARGFKPWGARLGLGGGQRSLTPA